MISNRKAFIVGLKSYKLSNSEKIFLKKHKPWGVILFSRNIKSINQTKTLTDNIKKIFKDFCSDKSDEISNFFQVSWSQFAKTGSPSSYLMDWDVYESNSSIAYINSIPKIKTFKNKDRIKLLNESKLNS